MLVRLLASPVQDQSVNVIKISQLIVCSLSTRGHAFELNFSLIKFAYQKVSNFVVRVYDSRAPSLSVDWEEGLPRLSNTQAERADQCWEPVAEDKR